VETGPLSAVPMIKSSNHTSPRLARHAKNRVDVDVAEDVVASAVVVVSVAVAAIEQPRVVRVATVHRRRPKPVVHIW